jgi:hypothetical protein
VLVSYRPAAGMRGVLDRVVGLLDRRMGRLKQHHHDGGGLPGLGGRCESRHALALDFADQLKQVAQGLGQGLAALLVDRERRAAEVHLGSVKAAVGGRRGDGLTGVLQGGARPAHA